MKKNLAYVLLVMLVSVASCSFTNKSFENPDKDKLLIDLISYVLERAHYNPKDVNDSFSVTVYESFLEVIDPTKRYLLESDIKEFEKYKYQLDDQIKNTDIAFFGIVYDRLFQRMNEAKLLYKDVLSTPFNFSKKEDINIDYENLPFTNSKKALKNRWRKQLKYATISDYNFRQEEEAKKKEKGETFLSNVAIEKEVREATESTLGEFFDFIDDLERKDWFVQYINSIVEGFDPHTFYLAPRDKERFDMNISGKFEGIGARLQKKRDHIKIIEIISGGPVWRGQKLEVGDEIVKVAQADGEPVDVVGMRLDDAVKLIKGKKGSEVRLTVRRVDGTTEVVSILRDVVELEESYAKSATVKKGNKTFGVINLPKFYVDFKDYNNRNAASDVKKEIIRLKKAGMEGLVMDLRDNGGGSLKTVIDMAGLFIKDGPVVQVRSSGDRKEVYEDKDERIFWDGPLVILVNELSASASEILAAAMQDYKRAIIIGSKQTFGKGTVQNVIGLDDIVRNSEHGDLGALKLTTQKFYRINGGSTQLEGVKSDVIVVDRYSYINIGEKDQDNPLPWDKISSAYYDVWDGYIDYESTIKKSKSRMEKNKQLSLIDENAQWVKKQRDVNVFSLNLDEYKEKLASNRERLDYFKPIGEYKTSMSFSSLPYELKQIEKDSVLGIKRTRWHKSLSGDVYMEEALNVLEDLQMSKMKKSVANIKG